MEGGEDAEEEARGGEGEDESGGIGCEPEEGPEGGVAEDAEEVGEWLANANGARPAELMFPDGGPGHRRGPTFDDDGGKGDVIAALCDAVA